MRTIFVGDVHGCLAELKDLVRCLEPGKNDRFIFLGDLVDRGDDSLGVLRYVRDLIRDYPRSIAICGNHEYEAFYNYSKKKTQRKNEAWTKEAQEADWNFIASMPLVYKLHEIGAVGVHAGFFPKFFEHYSEIGIAKLDNSSWKFSNSKYMERGRRFMRVRRVNADGNMVALGTELPEHQHWSSLYNGREGIAFYGHDVVGKDVRVSNYAYGLDTGCVYGGKLTAAIVVNNPQDPRIVSVSASRVYTKPNGYGNEEENGTNADL